MLNLLIEPFLTALFGKSSKLHLHFLTQELIIKSLPQLAKYEMNQVISWIHKEAW